MFIFLNIASIIAAIVFGIAADRFMSNDSSKCGILTVCLIALGVLIFSECAVLNWNNPVLHYSFKKIVLPPGSSEIKYGEHYALDIENPGHIAIENIGIQMQWNGYQVANNVFGISGQIKICEQCVATNKPIPGMMPVNCDLNYLSANHSIQLEITGYKKFKGNSIEPNFIITAKDVDPEYVSWGNLESLNRAINYY